MLYHPISQLVPPHRHRSILHRARLTNWLDEHLEHCRLVIVTAPAGYGKTSLLADFAHETSLPVCWYTLEPFDRDPQVFLEHLITALEQRLPAVGTRIRPMFAREMVAADPLAVVSALATELREHVTSPFVIIFDDYHTVAEADAIHRLINAVVDLLPPVARVILSSRTLPLQLDLTRLQIHQQVAGIGVSELAFTPEEICALARQNEGVEISRENAHAIATQTEGWIAGILLMTPALWPPVYQRVVQGRDPRDAVFDFLAHQTLDPLTPELQRFVLDASILSPVDVSTCDEILGTHHSAEYLRCLEERHLFVVRLADAGDGPTYRFHSLFREFLQHRLRETAPARARALHQRAAQVFAERAAFDRAIPHYLAAEMFDEAASTLEQIAPVFFDAGRWIPLAEWIDTLPAEVLEAHPRLMVTRAMVYAETGNIAEAEQHYTRAIQLYEQQGDAVSVARVIVWRAMLWNLCGRYADAIVACGKVIKTLRAHHAQPELARAYRVLGVAHAQRGDYPRCVRELEKSLAMYTALGDPTRVAWLHHDLGTCLRRFGDPSADEHYQHALTYWRETQQRVGMATTLNSLGVSAHRAGDYPRALAILTEAYTLAEQIGNPHCQAFVLASLGDVLRDQGEYPRALEQYQRVVELGERVEGFILTYGLVALGETLHLTGEDVPAATYLQRARAVAQAHHSPYEMGLVETALGIAATEQGRYADARAHLQQAVGWLAPMRGDALRAQLYLARVYWLQRRWRKAQQELRRLAKRWAEPIPAPLPFRVTDRARLLPLVQYAVNRKSGARYFQRILEELDARLRPATPPVIEARALGTTQVRMGNQVITKAEWGTQAAKELFFLLLTFPNGLRKEQILEALWPHHAAAAASVIFHTTAYRVRRVIPRGLVYADGMYTLRRDVTLHYDVAEFDKWLALARETKGVSERIAAYRAAIALYRGDFCEDSYHDWCEETRARLRRQYLDALLALAELYERNGDLAQAITYYQMLIERDMDREEIYRALMRLQIQAGDRLAAARTYQRCAQVLREELNIASPSEETRQLYAQIVQRANEPIAQ